MYRALGKHLKLIPGQGKSTVKLCVLQTLNA